MGTGADGARPATEQLREQVEQHRRELADTVAALHDKTDVKGRAEEKAADAEIAAADLALRAGRTAGAGSRFVRWTVGMASEQVRKLPEQIRTPVGRAAESMRRRLLAVFAVTALAAAVLAARRRHRG